MQRACRFAASTTRSVRNRLDATELDVAEMLCRLFSGSLWIQIDFVGVGDMRKLRICFESLLPARRLLAPLHTTAKFPLISPELTG